MRIPSCRTVANPDKVKVTEYWPTGMFSKRYAPSLSVTATAVPIRAGLLASTVTPTSTPPVSSLTLPRMPPVEVCAATVLANAAMYATTAQAVIQPMEVDRDDQRAQILNSHLPV